MFTRQGSYTMELYEGKWKKCGFIYNEIVDLSDIYTDHQRWRKYSDPLREATIWNFDSVWILKALVEKVYPIIHFKRQYY